MLNLYNGREQKERIDEALEDLMPSHGFEQRYKDDFLYLAFNYAAVGIALGAYYIEKTHTFFEGKWLIAACCAIYYALHACGHLFRKYVLKEAFYTGVELSSGRKLRLSSTNPANTSKYELNLFIYGKTSGVQVSDIKFDFMELVDRKGRVHADKLKPVFDLIHRKNE